jgi:predicted phosphohydrolase
MLQIIRPELLYTVRNEYGDNLDFSSASGWEIPNHLRHNVTNYDDDIALRDLSELQLLRSKKLGKPFKRLLMLMRWISR